VTVVDSYGLIHCFHSADNERSTNESHLLVRSLSIEVGQNAHKAY
jgi:hypothetical protein